MKRVRTTDDQGVSLSDLLRRIEKLEQMLGLRTSTTNDAHLSPGGRVARAMRDTVQSINAENNRFWAKENA